MLKFVFNIANNVIRPIAGKVIKNFPSYKPLLKEIGEPIYTLLRIYLVLVELRLLISWFISINPYFEPFESLWRLTDPIYTFGYNSYPRILGQPSSVFYNTLILSLIIVKLDTLLYGIDQYNYSENIMDADLARPHLEYVIPDEYNEQYLNTFFAGEVEGGSNILIAANFEHDLLQRCFI